MKTITIPDTTDTFTIKVRTDDAPDDLTVIDVYDADKQPVAVVALYSDGSTELEWSNGSRSYRNRDNGWWADLATEVAKAAAE